MNKNTHAGVGCYSWGDTNTTYAMMVNQYNGVEVWWKDTDQNAESSGTHPINNWTNATGASFSGVYPSTSLGYTYYFYTQMQDGSMMGRNFTWAAENSTVGVDQTITIGNLQRSYPGIKGTRFTADAMESYDGTDLLVFYQTSGNDITLFRRGLGGVNWDSKQLNIPDD